MDANLESIGARCTHCLRQDFLPFTCRECKLPFCIDHTAPQAHNCHAAATHTTSSPGQVATKPRNGNTATTQLNAATKGPSLKTLQAQHLARRGGANNNDNLISVAQKKSTPSASLSSKSSDALASIAALSKNVFTIRGKSNPNTQRLVELGRTKRDAKGPSTIPLESRLYLLVRDFTSTTTTTTTTPAATPNNKAKDKDKKGTDSWDGIPTYVHSDWSVGRALDALCLHLSILNENARTQDESRKLRLLHVESGMVLEPSQNIRKVVVDGSRIAIFRGSKPNV